MKLRSDNTCAARSSERGFTLIETSIALVVMMIVGLAASSLFFFAAQNNSGASDRQLSMALAQKRMEWLRSIPLNDTTRDQNYSYPDGGLKATAQAVTENVTHGGRPYEVITTIKDTDTDGDNTATSNANPATLKTITVRVRPLGGGPQWSQVNSVYGSVTLTTQRSMVLTGPHRNTE
jgi:Tfp pilus assembly protein PilV